MSRHVTILMAMSLNPMLHVDFHKRLCRPDGFKGQGPSYCPRCPLSAPPPGVCRGVPTRRAGRPCWFSVMTDHIVMMCLPTQAPGCLTRLPPSLLPPPPPSLYRRPPSPYKPHHSPMSPTLIPPTSADCPRCLDNKLPRIDVSLSISFHQIFYQGPAGPSSYPRQFVGGCGGARGA